MAVKYTEERLNTVDKLLLIQMFLNLSKQLMKPVPYILCKDKRQTKHNLSSLPTHRLDRYVTEEEFTAEFCQNSKQLPDTLSLRYRFSSP